MKPSSPSRPRTLREIAKAAEVSVATVSYVLNGKGRVAPERRRSIERLLIEAGQRPRASRDPVLYLSRYSGLRSAAAPMPYLHKVDGLDEALAAEQLPLRMEYLRPEEPTPEAVVARAMSHKPRGVVLDSNLDEYLANAAEQFRERGVPVVQLGHTSRDEQTDAVVIDDFQGAYTGTKKLIDRGHRRIATIRWNTETDPASRRKHSGFRCAIEEAKLELPPAYVVDSPPSRQKDQLTGRVAVQKLLDLPEPPSAVFVENTFVSPSLLYPISPKEPCLPEPITALDMVHFEAWDLDPIEKVMTGVFCYPPRDTTLLKINWTELGRLAGARIVQRIRGEVREVEIIRLTPRPFRVKGYEQEPC